MLHQIEPSRLQNGLPVSWKAGALRAVSDLPRAPRDISGPNGLSSIEIWWAFQPSGTTAWKTLLHTHTYIYIFIDIIYIYTYIHTYIYVILSFPRSSAGLRSKSTLFWATLLNSHNKHMLGTHKGASEVVGTCTIFV